LNRVRVPDLPIRPPLAIDRRAVLAAIPVAVAAASAPRTAHARTGFRHGQVQARAQTLAARPYQPPADDLPRALAGLDYDAYRNIRFRPDQALWRDAGLPFQLQFFHRGGFFVEKVELYQVDDGRARPIAYATDQFSFQDQPTPALGAQTGFAGFRIHAPLNTPDYYDEAAVFLGASYFRAVAQGMRYGLSARGLGIGIGEKEEFPAFRAFWIERPARDAASLTVHALLDGPSCTGAYRFVITPGVETVFDVSARLYPRVDIANAGLAPITSMYMWSGEGRRAFDDFRPEVHDSDGLAMSGAGGARAWRPLANPAETQVSAFQNLAAGFGLVQRQRDLDHYADLESRYDLRPDLWVEPVGDWRGEVRLLELPSRSEANDNIGAWWRPAQPMVRGAPVDIAYRLHWGRMADAPELARVVSTRSGAAHDHADRRLFVVDYQLPDALAGAELAPQVSADGANLYEIHLDRSAGGRNARLTLQIDPGRNRTVELRACLTTAQRPCSEMWLYRWTA
jgi:glucans biosynthesis protein